MLLKTRGAVSQVVSLFQQPKSSFQPSKWESQRVAYLVSAMKKGWISLDEEPAKKPPTVYQMWQDDEIHRDGPKDRHERRHIPAPKMPLPGHAERYWFSLFVA